MLALQSTAELASEIDKCHTSLAGQLEDACCLASLHSDKVIPVLTIKLPVKPGNAPSQLVRPGHTGWNDPTSK